jgi:CxxH/CxxC protein (TIGR04129 family)
MNYSPEREIIMLFACAIHLEDALDDYVNLYEHPPDIVFISELFGGSKESSSICFYCEHLAIYVLRKAGGVCP